MLLFQKLQLYSWITVAGASALYYSLNSIGDILIVDVTILMINCAPVISVPRFLNFESCLKKQDSK
jgi:hypothetical protein